MLRRTVMRGARLILILSIGLVPFLARAVDKELVEQAQAMIKAGKVDAAYQLLEAKEAEHAGDLFFDYLLATAALESGKPSKATFVYERILAIDPSYLGVGRSRYAEKSHGNGGEMDLHL